VTDPTDDTSRPIYVELEVKHDEMPLAGVVAAHPDAAFELEFQRVGGDARQPFLTVAGLPSETVEAALSDDPTVEDALSLGAVGDHLVYRLRVSDAVRLLPPDATDLGIRILRVVSADGTWRLKLLGPDRTVLEALRIHYHRSDVPFRVKRLHEAGNANVDSGINLSTVHRETLTTAYETGYFEVPRRITQGELAEELELSRSGLSQRLRRAVATLIEQVVLD
jgi:predicted DNA binding protein